MKQVATMFKCLSFIFGNNSYTHHGVNSGKYKVIKILTKSNTISLLQVKICQFI